MRFSESKSNLLKKFRGEDDDITFREADARGVHHPHNNPLVITAMIGNLNVHRMLVDDKSSVYILYLEAFKKIGLDQRDLKPSTSPLFGFMNDYTTPIGTNALPITLSDYPR